MTTDIDRAKAAIRERVWARLEEAGVVEPGVRGYIPDFVGKEEAADRLASLPVWQNARVVQVNPDRAQQPVRARALRDGKLLYMAVPKLAEERPFYVLDPDKLTVSPEEAADREVAARIGRLVDVDEMRPIDLVVCGSVAVNHDGARLGKGAGYSDREVALLSAVGHISPRTPIATTVHYFQILSSEIPYTSHDFEIRFIVSQIGIRMPISLHKDNR